MASNLVMYPADPKQAAMITNQSTALSAPGTEGPGTAPVKMLDLKHPEFALKIEAWQDLLLLRESGVMLAKKAERLLQKRPREDPEVYNARRERFTHQPILGTALGWYQAAAFQDEPQFFFYTGSGPQLIELDQKRAQYYKDEFLMNCDGNRTRFVDFTKKIFSDLLTYGVAYVLTDLPSRNQEDAELTLQQEQEKGYLDPFLVSYTPMEVINWSCDRTGAFDWVIVKTTKEESKFLQNPEEVDTWYYFDRENYSVYEDRRKLGEVSIPTDSSGRTARKIKEGRHALADVGRVPLRPIYLTNKLWLANRAYLLMRDHLNQDNSLGWALFMSNLAVPVIIGDVDTSNMNSSESGYYQFPAGTEYKWTEPEGKSFNTSMARLENLREEAFRCMYLQSQGMSMRATPQMQSGRSKTVSMVPTHEVLTGMGHDFKERVQSILEDVKDARRDQDVEPDVHGFNYQDDMTTEEVFAVSSLLGLRIPSGTFEKYIYKKLIKSWARDSNQKMLEAMYAEVEAGPTIDDRAQGDMEMRMELVKKGLEKAISGKVGSLPMPPGRGGSGPSPITAADSDAATI